MSGPNLICRKGEGENLNILGTTLRFLCHAEDTKRAWSVMENVLPENAGPPLHHHSWDECYFVTAGEVEFQIGDRRERVREGDFVYTPGGVVHAFRGLSKTPAKLVIFDAPAFTEAYFKEIDREVKELPRDFEKVPGIAARNGLHIIGPAVW